MQFNALDRQLGGKLSALKETVKLSIDSLKAKVERVEKELKSDWIKDKPDVAHHKKRRLYNLKKKIEKLENRKATSMAFGSRVRFRQQFYKDANGLKNHSEWLTRWRDSRSNQFLCLGMAAAPSGNSSCSFTVLSDTVNAIDGELIVRSFAGIPTITIPVRFTHQLEHLRAALKANSAITYRFYRGDENKKWHVHATLDRAFIPIVTDHSNGQSSVDINRWHTAIARINNDGNLVDVFDVSFRFKKNKYESGGRRKHLIAITSKKLVAYAQKHKTPLVIEKLDFAQKKQELKSRGYNKMLSSFAYSSFSKAIHSAAHRVGVEVIEVNPANSSIIGNLKFARGMGLSIHQGAALDIARRGATTFSTYKTVKVVKGEKKTVNLHIPHTKFSECLRTFPSSNPPVLPVRNRTSHVCKDWRKVKLPTNSSKKNRPSLPKAGRSGRGAKAPVTAQENLQESEEYLNSLVGVMHPGTGNAKSMPVSGKEEVNCKSPKLGELSAQQPAREY